MKMVIAIIKPFKLDDVRAALADVGVQGITVTGSRLWPAKATLGFIWGAEYVVASCPK